MGTAGWHRDGIGAVLSRRATCGEAPACAVDCRKIARQNFSGFRVRNRNQMLVSRIWVSDSIAGVGSTKSDKGVHRRGTIVLIELLQWRGQRAPLLYCSVAVPLHAG